MVVPQIQSIYVIHYMWKVSAWRAHCCQLAQNKTNTSNEVNKNKAFGMYRNFHLHNFYMYNILQALNSAFY